MSFREEEEPALVDYWNAMQRAAKRAKKNFELRRIDEVEGDYEIVQRMYEEIDAADFVIADLTLSPQNVYLETGYARGRGKPVIQTCRKDTSLEFDVRGTRTLIGKTSVRQPNEFLISSVSLLHERRVAARCEVQSADLPHRPASTLLQLDGKEMV